MIGTLGPVTFNVSRERVQNFEDFDIESSARIATHENLQNKPIVEFVGPDLDKISLKMKWSIAGKLNPLKEIEGLLEKQENGEVILFFLAGKPVGKGKYLIESISRVNRVVDNRGNILSMEITISLLEYAENAKKAFTTKTEALKQTKSSSNSNAKKIPKVKKESTTKNSTTAKKKTKKKTISKQKTRQQT